jgi:hypothetical protein
MAFLSEAEEVEVLRNEPAYRINVSPHFENNNRIRCFALKQHGSCKMPHGNCHENNTPDTRPALPDRMWRASDNHAARYSGSTTGGRHNATSDV